MSDVATQAGITTPDIPDEIDVTGGTRGRYFPQAEPERSQRLMTRLKTMQDTAAHLHDEHCQLRVLLAWEAGLLTAGEAAQQLALDPVELPQLRDAALRVTYRAAVA